MNKQKPINLTLNFLNEMGVAANNDYAFINREMGIVNSMYEMNNRFFHVGQPYRTKEMRILRGLRGSARMSVNLMEYTIKEHTIGLIPPNALLQIVDISGDYDIQALAADNNFIPTQQHSILTDWHTQQAFFLDNHVEEWRRTGTFFSLIWDAVHLQPYRREVVQHLITSLLYNVHYLQGNYHRDELLRPSRHEELFRRFITLVNEHCKTQRTTTFYADRLCLSPRYLSSVIRNVSGRTVVEWVNQAVILEAKVLLKHSDLLTYQIADELHFPNPSFFSKFFKQMTGMTPQEYQRT